MSRNSGGPSSTADRNTRRAVAGLGRGTEDADRRKRALESFINKMNRFMEKMDQKKYRNLENVVDRWLDRSEKTASEAEILADALVEELRTADAHRIQIAFDPREVPSDVIARISVACELLAGEELEATSSGTREREETRKKARTRRARRP